MYIRSPGIRGCFAMVVRGMEDRSGRTTGSIGGSAFTGNNRPSVAFPVGRVCREPGCGTHLSIYNDGEYCYVHEPLAAPRLRGKKIA